MYIIRCADETLYVGSCWDLAVRVDQHVDGFGCAYTSKRKPVSLAHAEDFERRDDAWVREKQVQGWSHAKRLALIEGRLDDLRALSRSRASEQAKARRVQDAPGRVSVTPPSTVTRPEGVVRPSVSVTPPSTATRPEGVVGPDSRVE